MRLVHILVAEMHIVGGDQRQVLGIGQIDQRRFGGAFFGQAMALQLDIEPVAGNIAANSVQQRRGRFGLAIQQKRVDGTARSAGERDQAFGMFGQQRPPSHAASRPARP